MGIIRVFLSFFFFFFPLAVFAPEAVSAHSRSVAVRAPRVKHVGVCFSSCVRLFGFFYVCVFRVCVCVCVCVRARGRLQY